MATNNEVLITIQNDRAQFNGNVGLLETCMVYVAAKNRIEDLTGMPIDRFFAGMRELLAPAPEVTGVTTREALMRSQRPINLDTTERKGL